MKILWLSNKLLSDQDDGMTGTWLSAMAEGLSTAGDVELGNVSVGNVTEVKRLDCGPIRQWVVPIINKLNHTGLPPDEIVSRIISIVDEFDPDMVHVWGTENYWGLLTARNLIKRLSLLEMQGLKFAIAKVFIGGLTEEEVKSCIGIKEMLRRSSIYQGRNQFERWGSLEKEIISHHKHIAVQTKWVESQVVAINSACRIYNTTLVLREPFYKTSCWQYSGKNVIFCSAAYSSPFKGLHVAIRAVSTLRMKLPDVRLRIAGAHQKKGIRQDGYMAWLNREIGRLGVISNVEWTGPLNASQVANEMHEADVMLIPTFIENCCASMQEAMMVGIPVVATYTGGLPSLAKDEISALFFPIGDDAMCAYQLEQVMGDQLIAERLSHNARSIALVRNHPGDVINNQLKIYREVISAEAVC